MTDWWVIYDRGLHPDPLAYRARRWCSDNGRPHLTQDQLSDPDLERLRGTLAACQLLPAGPATAADGYRALERWAADDGQQSLFDRAEAAS